MRPIPNEGSITFGTNSLTEQIINRLLCEASRRPPTGLFEHSSFYLDHLRCQRKLVSSLDRDHGRPGNPSVRRRVNVQVEPSHPCANSPLSFNSPASSKPSTVFIIAPASLPNV